MLHRGASLFLAVVLCLCLAVLPFGNAAAVKTEIRIRSQGSALELSQTRVNRPDGGRRLNLTGQHQAGKDRVNLRAVTVASKPPKAGGAIGGIPGSPNLPQPGEEEYRPVEDYYYSYSEMSRSDGTLLVQATYEYEQPTNLNMLYINAGGVALSFDLNTEQPGPITASDLERLNQWLTSQDGILVQDTSVAIIEQGSQQADPELLMNYYAVAMMVDNNPPPETALKINNKGKSAHHRVRPSITIGPANKGNSADACLVSSLSFTGSGSLAGESGLLRFVVARPPAQCFGCCGLGCWCIRDRVGVPIYGGPCPQHDGCVGQYGYGALRCLPSFAASVAYVWRRVRPLPY